MFTETGARLANGFRGVCMAALILGSAISASAQTPAAQAPAAIQAKERPGRISTLRHERRWPRSSDR
jgi:hypothetical protein